MKYGYARVSTEKQVLDRQLDSLIENGVTRENIFTDKKSGKDFHREGYNELKHIIKKGDEVYIHALDRLSRNKTEMLEEFKWFRDNGIVLRILNVPTTLMNIDGQEWVVEMINNIILEVLGTFIEQERLELVKRTKEGLEATKRRGTTLGRKKVDVNKLDSVRELINHGYTVAKACNEAGISCKTWYNYN